MSRWAQQFNSHPFLVSLNELRDEIATITIGDGDSGITFELARLAKVAAFIESSLSSADPDLISFVQLDGVNQSLINSRNQVKAFIDNKNISSLVEANKAADNALAFTAQIFSLTSNHEVESLSRASGVYTSLLNKQHLEYKQAVTATLDELNKKVGEFNPKTEELGKTLESLKTQLQTVEQTIQAQTADFNKQFSASELDRGGKFDGVIDRLTQKSDQEFKELSIKAGKSLEVLSKYLDDSKKIFGVVVNTLQAGAYSSYANSEKKTANILRWVVLGMMGLAIIILIYPEILRIWVDGSGYEFDWKKALGRVPFSVVLFVPAFYLARESGKHRNNEILNRRRELILSTIDPYLALLTADKADQIKADIAKGIFSEGQIPSDSDGAEASNFIAQLTNLIKQVNK